MQTLCSTTPFTSSEPHNPLTNPTVPLPLHPTVPPPEHQSLIPPRPVPPSRQSYRLSYFFMTKPFPRQLSTQLPSHLPQYPPNLVLLRYPASTLTHDAKPRYLPTYLSSSPYLSHPFHTCPPFHTCLPPSTPVSHLPHLTISPSQLCLPLPNLSPPPTLLEAISHAPN
ncbi:hypothetical protein Pmani_020763 [Petrolisthes manimaculis]|uniref:Uncharacterized protein n=1 Tax=Petrolisthes manimaculis TaxID=1843537 RepID=A0AAE1TNW5_9EUCA|nr:hypothetical protein Pmani_034935 [Petrolisthes manimaculis]KAK4307474.1 hypothetical protein Pmani_020763 [Petrolisthes manimaculis]